MLGQFGTTPSSRATWLVFPGSLPAELLKGPFVIGADSLSVADGEGGLTPEFHQMSHQLLFRPFGFVKPLVLSFNEALLTIPFEHGAPEGAALPAQARDVVLEPGGCGTGFPRSGDKLYKRVDASQYHIWVTVHTQTLTLDKKQAPSIDENSLKHVLEAKRSETQQK